MQAVKEKALELLQNGTVKRVLGWKTGEFFYDLTPAVFESAEEVEKDEEGLQTMRVLGKNMAWILKCLEAGKKAGVEPKKEEKIKTNFIR